jgi:predicted  nucleic acid-binding Zn-ribbon protein
MQEIEINSLRRILEKKTSDEGGVSRTLKTLGDEMLRFQQEVSELRRFSSERLDMNRDKISKLRDEFETRSLTIENKLHRCMDNQTGLETDTSHTRAELNRMSKTVMEAITVMDELDLTKASVSCIEKQQQEFSEFAHQVSDHVGVLRQQFGTLVDDVKAHFETASKVVATSTEKQVADMRESYRSEVTRMDTALSNIESFLKSQSGNETALKDDVEGVRQMAKLEMADMKETLHDADSKRAKHCNRLDLDMQQLRRKVNEIEGSFAGVGSGAEVSGAVNLRNDLLAMLVESQQLAAALAWQDNQDRKRVALFGFKGHRKEEKLPGIETAKSMSTPRRPTLGRLDDDQEIMTLDQRCLSCNSNRGMALAGFKIACLSYSPTPVEYQKSNYSREELLRLQMDLLKQAQETLRSNAA